ncbi:tripartite tricarboxylate transporter substrate binding protein [Oceanobacillus sp. Castelsardo]|uniref:tripartite tricarboxylate transporter substrate binding protein n=1 Tax=Oceanobacillus sp. Castelsardo TaxID=1851204 RepID=UPI0008386351|nr:tripartite tricarboxylate transporter substrate binding protein [Oceanobacillus sp. Castelsardo]
MRLKSFYVGLLVMVLALFLGACNSSSTASNAGKSKDGNEELPKDYPNKPIDALVGFAPGGGQDLIMRTTGEILNSEGLMEQPFVVENKPGAGGVVAAKEAAKKKDDPYLLQVMPEYGAGWIPESGIKFTEFKPIASLGTSEIFIIVKADSPYKTIDDLFEAFKTDHDMTVATLGPIEGGEVFRWEELRKEVGIEKLNYVPKGGAAEGLTAVLGGQVDATFAVPAVIKDYIKTGEIRALAVLSDERSEVLPDVPTLKESGTDYEYTRFVGIWTGANVSDAVVSYWEDKLKKMTETDAWMEFLKKRGLAPYFKGTNEYTELIIEEGSKYEAYLKSLQK